jgi:hypothetical protein
VLNPCNEGFGFVIISSVSRAGSTIGRIIPGTPPTAPDGRNFGCTTDKKLPDQKCVGLKKISIIWQNLPKVSPGVWVSLFCYMFFNVNFHHHQQLEILHGNYGTVDE